jgi:hypothetical protein
MKIPIRINLVIIPIIGFISMSCSINFSMNSSTSAQMINIAPSSSLQKEIPGYVDEFLNANGSGCGGGGGPCINSLSNSRINIIFNKTYRISKIILYVGCNDGEMMDGQIINISKGANIILKTFYSVGCGDSISFDEVKTDRIAILMIAGGGTDHQISVEEIEVYGR